MQPKNKQRVQHRSNYGPQQRNVHGALGIPHHAHKGGSPHTRTNKGQSGANGAQECGGVGQGLTLRAKQHQNGVGKNHGADTQHHCQPDHDSKGGGGNAPCLIRTACANLTRGGGTYADG